MIHSIARLRPIFLVALALAGTGAAYPQSPKAAGDLSCQTVAVTPLIRASGLAELVGEIVVICDNPIADGSYEQYVTADLSLSFGYAGFFGPQTGLLGITNNIDFGEGLDITDAVLIINENHDDPVTTSTFGGPDPRFPIPQYGRYVPDDINSLIWQGVNIPIPGEADPLIALAQAVRALIPCPI